MKEIYLSDIRRTGRVLEIANKMPKDKKIVKEIMRLYQRFLKDAQRSGVYLVETMYFWLKIDLEKIFNKITQDRDSLELDEFIKEVEIAVTRLINQTQRSREYFDSGKSIKLLEMFLIAVKGCIYRNVISRELKEKGHDVILVVPWLHLGMLHQISAKVVGIVAREVSQEEVVYREYAHMHDMAIVISKKKYQENEIITLGCEEPVLLVEEKIARIEFDKTSEIFNLYQLLCTVDQQKIAEHTAGVVYPLDYLYSTNLTWPTAKELNLVFQNLSEKCQGKEIVIGLPDFREERPILYLHDDIIIDVTTYYRFESEYEKLIKELIKVFGLQKIKLYLPMVLMNEDYELQKEVIDNLFEKYGHSNYEVGISIGTDVACEYFKDFCEYDFVVINTDDLIGEISFEFERFDQINLETYLFELRYELSSLHLYYRKKGMQHIVIGNHNNNREIFDKLTKMGFREFAVTKQFLPQSLEIANEFTKRRGKYKGIHQKRVKKDGKK